MKPVILQPKDVEMILALLGEMKLKDALPIYGIIQRRISEANKPDITETIKQ